jgi:hypothetical protein
MLRTAARIVLVSALSIGFQAGSHGETPPPGGNLGQLLNQYRNMTLAAHGVEATGQVLSIGHMEMQFERGQIVPLVNASGEPMGFVFEGFGTYKYLSEDARDRQVIEANLTAITNAPIFRDFVVSDKIERMLLFFGRPDFEPVWKSEDEGAAAGAEVQQAFNKIWKRIEKTYLEYDHYAAEARLNGGDQQYIYAEIEGGKETVGYSYDDVRGFRERMFLFRKFSGFDLRFKRGFSAQDVHTAENLRPAAAVLRHADLVVDTDDNRSASIQAGMRYEIGRDETQVVPLLMINHRDPNNYDWRAKNNVYSLLSVTDKNGKQLSFSHRYHEVLVQLDEPASAGDSVELQFEMKGEILTGMTQERHDNYFELFSDNWFPEPYGSGSSNHTFTLKARTKKPYRPVASGSLISFSEDGDYYDLETASDVPVEYLGLFAGKYKISEQTFGDRTVRMFGYATASKKMLENLPKLANAFIEFYEQMLGPYPFKELDIVEVPEYGFGIAPPGMVLLTSEAYKPHQDFLAEYFSRGINARLAHEIAHQWFGHMANPLNIEDQWISESLAEYMAGMAMAALASNNKRIFGFNDMLDQWRRRALESAGAGPLTAANFLSGPDAGSDRFKLLYARGPLVMRMLHVTVGNERFYGILKTLLSKGDVGYVDTEDFRESAEEVLKSNMDWFVDGWIKSGGVPEISVKYEISAAGEGVKLTGTAKVNEGSVYKRMIIPIVLDLGGERPSIVAVDLDQPEKPFSFDLPKKPRSVKIDPGHNCLAQFN